MEKRLTLFFALAFFIFIAGYPAKILAAPQEKGDKKCTDGIDNDGDGKIDGDDPDCGATNVDDVSRRARVFLNPGSIHYDGGGELVGGGSLPSGCGAGVIPAFAAPWDYWHSNPGQGPHDSDCDDTANNGFGEPSQRVNSAMLACGWCFNTFGPARPLDDNAWHHVNRYFVFDFSTCFVDCPDIDTEIANQVASDPDAPPGLLDAIPTPNSTAGFDNLEVRFNIDPSPFVSQNNVENFEIEVLGPRARRNGRIVWDTKYVLAYSNSLTVSLDDANVVTVSTTGSGAAVLTRLSDGELWNVDMPFSITVRQVFDDSVGNCCQEEPPTN